MIIETNVCDNCGTSIDIKVGKFCGIVLWVFAEPVSVSMSDKYYSKGNKLSFCGKDCAVNYIKENLSENGEFNNDNNEDKVPF